VSLFDGQFVLVRRLLDVLGDAASVIAVTPAVVLPGAFPCSADNFKYLAASALSFVPPDPLSEQSPQQFCASAYRWSAARLKYSAAFAISGATPNPFRKQ
jgi:hypothetical protein